MTRCTLFCLAAVVLPLCSAPARAQEPEDQQGRTFNSSLELTVFVFNHVAVGKLIGETPSKDPVSIPGGAVWGVAPGKDVTWPELRREVMQHRIPALYLSEDFLSPEILKEVAAMEHMRVLQLYGYGFRAEGLSTLAGSKSMEELRFYLVPVKLTDLAPLEDKVQLEKLSFASCGWYRPETQDLEVFKGFPKLRSLNLTGLRLPQNPEPLIDILLELENLEELRLPFSSPIDDANLERLCELEKLRVLEICSSDLTVEGLAHLLSLPRLRELRIGGGLTDAGMQVIGKSKSLRVLDVSRSAVSDKGLSGLEKIEAFEGLDLSSTSITDKGLALLSKSTLLKRLNLSKTPVTQVGLAHLRNLKKLRILDLQSTGACDENMPWIGSLSQLEILDLRETKVTNEGLRHLEGLRNLWTLFLGMEEYPEDGIPEPAWKQTATAPAGSITDAGLEHVAKAKHLRNLHLVGTWITGEGFAAFDPEDRIRQISLRRSAFTDAGLEHISRLHKLTYLGLAQTRVTDKGIAHLSALGDLEILNLSKTQVTDNCLEALAEMKSLRSVHLRSTRVTAEGLQKLSQQRPGMRIHPAPAKPSGE